MDTSTMVVVAQDPTKATFGIISILALIVIIFLASGTRR